MKSKTVRIILPTIILIIVFAIILICAVNRNNRSIYIYEKNSYLSECKIVGDEVQFICYVTICNTYDTDKTVLIKGDFSHEVENGLISDKILYAVDSEKNKYQYILPPNEEKSFYVTFVGTFAGTEQMTSRQLPPMLVEEVS